tara:strand:+ start:76 stop:216 length:141 start_codon:yes stop_codon:yes gene_type:complete
MIKKWKQLNEWMEWKDLSWPTALYAFGIMVFMLGTITLLFTAIISG